VFFVLLRTVALIRVQRYLSMYFTPEILLNHVLEDLRKPKAPNKQHMKSQADKRRSEREFQVGDKVYLKLQSYVQSSVATRANHKLSFKYFGPYTILERVEKVAYKLQLPPSATVHPVVHVSQLKGSVGNQQVSAMLPDLTESTQIPFRALDRRVIHRGSSSIQQVLI
jgi:hypothetical protein